MLDQPILIVGSMVVGPESGPLAGLCVALTGFISHPDIFSFIVAFVAGVAGAARAPLSDPARGAARLSLGHSSRPGSEEG